MSIYDFETQYSSGDLLPLKEFKGKALLIVNTATQCGLTPQFNGLEALYEKYQNQGLVILGFPCNQFAKQEPLSNEEMAETCSLNYGVTFPLAQKIKVNGPHADPIYKYLKKALPGTLGNAIKWNFTKFLIGPQGQPIKRYAPTTEPESIEKDIVELLVETIG